MRLATRIFLWSFVPFACFLLGAFWNVQRLVQLTVREGVRSSLRQTHHSIANLRSKGELQNSRFLRILGENATLKAGMQLLNAAPRSAEARRTVEEQLRELCGTLRFDFLLVSDADRNPQAGVMVVGEQIVAMDTARIRPPLLGVVVLGGQAYQVVSTPIDQGDENLGTLSIGERFDLSEFTTPALLIHDGQVLKSNLSEIPLPELQSALKACVGASECEIRLRGEAYISLPLETISFGEGYVLRSLQSIDSANGPVQSMLKRLFLITGIGTLLAMVILSALSTHSIVRPIAGVVERLRQTENTGLLAEFQPIRGVRPIHEIRQLTDSFNRAARAIREVRENLREAYVEFVESLASALDARDRYTAGHSRRVSEYACLIARNMNLSEADLEIIRTGALLHDIGKIGIADHVLQKCERLTNDEYLVIQQHPTIGRRILERVGGFQVYLPIVELHHENWNGSGYPWGQRGEETPAAARIVHIADAYDAMTSDRPYRRALTHDEAIRNLQQNAGIQFDPAIVAVFREAIRSQPKSAVEIPAECSEAAIRDELDGRYA